MKTTRALAFTILITLVSLTTSPLPAQPSIKAVKTTNNNSQLRFDVTGGSGTFAVERANLATDPWCSIAAVNQRSNVLVGVDGPHACFRVRDLSNGAPTRMTVSLSGAAERPPNASNGNGFGTLEINGDTLTFDIAFRGLSIGSSAAHIHLPIDTSTNAAVSINFASFMIPGFGGTTGRIAGAVALTGVQKAAILSGLAYVNVHTTNFPGGEIRGQVTPTTFRVVMSAAAERPNVTASRGYGIGALNLIGNQLTYDIAYQGLTGTATASHIHGAAGMGGTAGVMYNLTPVGGFGASGFLSGVVTLTPAQIAALVDGKGYANIHTVANSDGEIRGQVLPVLGEAPFAADLTGSAQHPAVVTSASGFVFCALQSNVLSFAAMYRNLSGPATLAHFHGAAPTTTDAGPLFDLQPFHRGPYSTQGVFVGSITLTTAQVSNLINGDIYMNIHTVANGGGEIRGQLCHTIFPVTLNNGNEPGGTPVPSSGTGFGYVGLLGRQLSIGVHYRDLTGVANLAHIHGPGTTNQSVGVLINLDTPTFNAGGLGSTGFFLGSAATTDAIAANIVDFLTYLNIHTPSNGGGEIRGQVMP